MPRYPYIPREKLEKMSDAELAMFLHRETELRENQLKADVPRLRWAANQLDRVWIHLEHLNDDNLRRGLVENLSGISTDLQAVADEKVKEVRHIILTRNGEDSSKDVTQSGGRTNGGKGGHGKPLKKNE